MPSAASGLRHPASASCLGRHSRLAGRCPNNSSLFPPLAAVVVVAGHYQRKNYFLFGHPKSLRTFRMPFFTERGRDRKRQLQDLFLHFGKSVMLVVDAVFRCDPPVKSPIGKIRRFSRLANINSLSAKNAQSAAEGIPNRPALETFFRKSGQKDSIFCLLLV